MKRIFIVGGSPEVDIKFIARISDDLKNADAVYAVDKGLEICDIFDIEVKKIIGDFDSVKPKVLKNYPDSKKMKYSPEKDNSDLEITIDTVLNDYKDEKFEILIVNADRGRWDHFYFNLMLLFKKPNRIRMISGAETIWALGENHSYTLPGLDGITFSLLPASICTEVSIEGAKYPLESITLEPFTTRTLSNIAENNLKISFKTGQLLLYIGEVIL